MTNIAIQIDTPQGTRLLAAFSAREATLMAESVLAMVAQADLPISVAIACTDTDLADRLLNYLADVQMERVLAEATL